MLIDKYLSVYDFKEFHSIKANGPANEIYHKMLHRDLSGATVVTLLFWLRGIPKRAYTIEGLTKMGFIKLEENPGDEIVFGIVTESPMFNGCVSISSPSLFIETKGQRIIKAVINFKVEEQGSSKCVVSTETRIWCGSWEMKSKFRAYWFFVRPFSQIIRRYMLRQIKRLST
ncbi:MAG: hypothetical protein V4539_15865 [Bacteroidota bacterium]